MLQCVDPRRCDPHPLPWGQPGAQGRPCSSQVLSVSGLQVLRSLWPLVVFPGSHRCCDSIGDVGPSNGQGKAGLTLFLLRPWELLVQTQAEGPCAASSVLGLRSVLSPPDPGSFPGPTPTVGTRALDGSSSEDFASASLKHEGSRTQGTTAPLSPGALSSLRHSGRWCSSVSLPRGRLCGLPEPLGSGPAAAHWPLPTRGCRTHWSSPGLSPCEVCWGPRLGRAVILSRGHHRPHFGRWRLRGWCFPPKSSAAEPDPWPQRKGVIFVYP